jgi:hypothetical protein
MPGNSVRSPGQLQRALPQGARTDSDGSWAGMLSRSRLASLRRPSRLSRSLILF